MNLNEALETLENAGYLVESVNTPALVENLSEILLEVFEFDNASQLKSTVPNSVCYELDDGEHDVVLICEYFYEKDVLRVTLNYGDFEDTFKDFSKHVDIDKDGKISHDQELEDFAYNCNNEWTDAFGY